MFKIYKHHITFIKHHITFVKHISHLLNTSHSCLTQLLIFLTTESIST